MRRASFLRIVRSGALRVLPVFGARIRGGAGGEEGVALPVSGGGEIRELAEAFAVLTSDPLRGVADLPRLQREIGVLRQLPSRLEALRGPVPVAR